jgi:uncharacterized SAM-binding protein YcdF (DUF218 family)
MGAITYTQPLILLLLMLAVIGAIRAPRCKGTLLLRLALLGLVVLSWPPMDWLLSRPLEAWYPIRPFADASAEAIVVLSSYVHPPREERPYPLADRNTYQRCEYAAWLYKHYKHWRTVPVVVCGGPIEQPASVTMRELLERAGVPKSTIWTEESSHSTHENAVFGAGVLRQHGIGTIALVVEAQSMLRAEASFRKQGIRVVAAPCAFRTFDPSFEEFIPNWKAISRNEDSLHETLGLGWYWLRGWI